MTEEYHPDTAEASGGLCAVRTTRLVRRVSRRNALQEFERRQLAEDTITFAPLAAMVAGGILTTDLWVMSPRGQL